MERTQRNAVGVVIIVTIKDDGAAVDISTVTTKEFIFKKPNGETVTKDATFVTDGSDGRIQYTTETGFLDQPGTWHVQGYVVFPGSFDGRSANSTFYVGANL